MSQSVGRPKSRATRLRAERIRGDEPLRACDRKHVDVSSGPLDESEGEKRAPADDDEVELLTGRCELLPERVEQLVGPFSSERGDGHLRCIASRIEIGNISLVEPFGAWLL